MLRLLFEKKGRSVWISHLDLMRLFQRAFKRAGLPLTHTQGFNPRPSVSIALPLSVGVESQCELLDFELETCDMSTSEIRDKLNEGLVAGVRVLDVYKDGGKIRDLCYLQCKLVLEYDKGVSDGCVDALRTLFASESIIVPKKTKNGIQDQNITSMIKEISFVKDNDREVVCHCTICCQNPTLNPAQIPLAIEKYCPEWKADFCRIIRLEIFDQNLEVFR